MIKEELLDLINNLENVDGKSIEKLDEVKNDHPYFQAIPILQAKIANDTSYEDKKNYISRAAIYTADRKNLKDLIEDQKVIAKVIVTPEEDVKDIQSETISQNKPATAPSEVEKPLKEAVEEEKKKVYDSAAATSNDLYDEVMKNLKTLRSLREQYDFLEEKIEKEEQESEEETEEKIPAKKGGAAKKAATAKSTKKSTTKKKPAGRKKTAQKTENNSVKEEKKSAVAEEKEKIKVEDLHEISDNVKKIDLNEQNSIIDSFIKNEPRIARKKPDDTVENKNDLSENSTKITDELVSENLADIMLSQGKTDKAVEIYKKLIWKFPQKKAYFASRIEELTKK